jgi:hypothetical protein
LVNVFPSRKILRPDDAEIDAPEKIPAERYPFGTIKAPVPGMAGTHADGIILPAGVRSRRKAETDTAVFDIGV